MPRLAWVARLIEPHLAGEPGLSRLEQAYLKRALIYRPDLVLVVDNTLTPVLDALQRQANVRVVGVGAEAAP